MKQIFQISFIFVFLLLSACMGEVNKRGYTGTLHAIILADTDDSTIGKSTGVNMQEMVKLAKSISKYTGLKLNGHKISGSQLIYDGVMTILENLPVRKNDVVIFYYAGHGLNSGQGDKWPMMRLKDHDLLLSKVFDKMQQKAPRLLLVIVDTVNTINNGLFFVNPKSADNATPKSEHYRELFLNSRGSIIASGARPGQYSWSNSSVGGFFTYQWLKSLHTELSSNNPPSWKTIMKRAAKIIHLPNGVVQNPQSQVVIYKIPNKIHAVPLIAVQPPVKPKPIIPTTSKPTDTTPPRIVLNTKTRGPTNELVADTNSYTLSGQAIDDSKIAFVKVNGKKARVNQQGYFTVQLALKLGTNRISVKAADIHNNVSSKNIVLSRQEIKPPTIRFAGNYHALIIGINQYKYLNNLNTAVNDAKTVAKVLENQYGFSVKLLLNQQATRSGIMNAFNKLNRNLDKNDHLLIYYAGHGYFDKQGDAAFWLPADANKEDTEWLSASTITTQLRRNQAKNILIVADSCYSGTLTRQRGNDMNFNVKPKERQHYLQKMLDKPSRVLISSGGNEPVTDSGGRGHSIFAQVFLDGLLQMEATAFTAEELFIKSSIQERVAGKVEQIPEFQIIRQSGHDSGDFVFQRK